jgi:HSP20 family protein
MARLIRRDPNRGLTSWSPFDNFVEDFFRGPSAWEDLGQVRHAAADVYETDTEVVVKMAVPGINPDDINIQISGDTVTVSGETREEKEDKEKNYYQKQLRYGRFSQSVVLPTSVQADKADASFKNGMLTLILPKSEELRPKQIKVRVEDK